MLLHVFVGDGQLEVVPKDVLSLRLNIVTRAGREYPVASSWTAGSILRFHHTVVVGNAEDESVSSLTFNLMGTYRQEPGTEVLMGQAALQSTSIGSKGAITKVLILLNGGTTVGRFSTTLFLNKYPIDLAPEQVSRHEKTVAAKEERKKATTKIIPPSSREYAFLLSRRQNWKEGEKSSFNSNTERMLDEDVSANMLSLRKSLRESGQTPASIGASKKKEPVLAYSKRPADSPGRKKAVVSPLRKTIMGVGYVGSQWPSSPPAAVLEQISNEQAERKLKLAEERRIEVMKAVAEQAHKRAIDARDKSEMIKKIAAAEEVNDDKLRAVLLKREEELKNLRNKLATERRKAASLAQLKHIQESKERKRLKEEEEKKEKALMAKMLKDAAADSSTPAPPLIKWEGSMVLKAPIPSSPAAVYGSTASSSSRQRSSSAGGVKAYIPPQNTQPLLAIIRRQTTEKLHLEAVLGGTGKAREEKKSGGGGGAGGVIAKAKLAPAEKSKPILRLAAEQARNAKIKGKSKSTLSSSAADSSVPSTTKAATTKVGKMRPKNAAKVKRPPIAAAPLLTSRSAPSPRLFSVPGPIGKASSVSNTSRSKNNVKKHDDASSVDTESLIREFDGVISQNEWSGTGKAIHERLSARSQLLMGATDSLERVNVAAAAKRGGAPGFLSMYNDSSSPLMTDTVKGKGKGGGGDGGAAPFGFAPSPSLSLPEGADKDKYEHLLARLNNTSTSTASALLIDEKSRLKDMVQTLEKQGVTIDDKMLSVLRNLREKEKEAAVEEVNSPSYGKAALREALFGNGGVEEED